MFDFRGPPSYPSRMLHGGTTSQSSLSCQRARQQLDVRESASGSDYVKIILGLAKSHFLFGNESKSPLPRAPATPTRLGTGYETDTSLFPTVSLNKLRQSLVELNCC